ncbi:hypothetical protein [Streptomyces sp. enrichment culture]|uniref:hypothetical protein n=1 Tax=Streptomyces sp. enrichment culture TaxID=1795815 RepID=UPI003F5725AF
MHTVLSEEEAALTDTSSRRRAAQRLLTLDVESDVEGDVEAGVEGDARHHDVVRAAREGRLGEAAELAVIGERDDIRAYGINSREALAWLSTRAVVAELSGSATTAAQLRATVTRMGGEINWWENAPGQETAGGQVGQDGAPLPSPGPAEAAEGGQPVRRRWRVWLPAAAAAVLALAVVGVWQQADADSRQEERQQRAATYKGKSAAKITADGVDAEVVARWTKGRDAVIVELRSYLDPDAAYLRVEAGGRSAASTRGGDRYVRDPEVSVPVSDPLADVTVQVAVGGTSWKEGDRGTVRTIRLSPSDVAYDGETGEKLPG